MTGYDEEAWAKECVRAQAELDEMVGEFESGFRVMSRGGVGQVVIKCPYPEITSGYRVATMIKWSDADGAIDAWLDCAERYARAAGGKCLYWRTLPQVGYPAVQGRSWSVFSRLMVTALPIPLADLETLIDGVNGFPAAPSQLSETYRGWDAA